MKKKKGDEMDLSVVIPVKDEGGNVAHLHEELCDALDGMDIRYELLFVDDGSSDDTIEHLSGLSPVKIIRLNRNFGQSAAMQAGFDTAAGAHVVSMDGDRQNDPADIPALYTEVQKGTHDVICGWRQKRKDRLFKKVFSKLANALRRRLTGETIHDSGCSLRIYPLAAVQSLELKGEMHRYIPAMLRWKGYRIGETRVNHRPRTEGKTKYGWKRLVRGFLDLALVSFWYRYSARPMHFFGGFGVILMAIGTLLAAGMTTAFFWPDARAYYEPVFLALGVGIFLAGIIVFMMGPIAEILSRTYYGGTPEPYLIREIIEKQ